MTTSTGKTYDIKNYQQIFTFSVIFKTNLPKNELQPQKESFQYHPVDICICYCKPYSLEHKQFF